MKVIINNANLTNITKTATALSQYICQQGAKQRVTVDWISQNGCAIYSKGEKDKMIINVREG